jgi:glyoxylase-like metal-dependent hydrolase (beta-lactamase superfamily II)
MNRRHFLTLSSAALAAVPFRSILLAQGGKPPAWTPKFEAIRRNVGYFTARGGTIGWLVNPDAVLVVDTQFPDTAKACVEGLKERAKGRGFDLVINTHHHGDHTGGNAVFKEHAKKMLGHSKVPELQKQVAAQAASNPNAPQQGPPVVPDSTFDKTWSDSFGDEKVSARHYGPGHTGGDAVVHFERAEVVHMGDLLFNERHPRVDRPAGASIQNWMTTIEAVAKDMPANTIYIAGHAKEGLPVTVGRKELMRQRDYFDAVLKHTKGAIAAGKSKEEAAKIESLPGFEGYQAGGPMLSLGGVINVAYEELSSK